MIPDRRVARALVVVAHPDDVDFWAGGTVASWTSAGTTVAYLILTDGDSGGFDPRIPRSAIPDIRRDEQEAAASELGVDDARFLGYPDGRLAPSCGLRRDITRAIRQVATQRDGLGEFEGLVPVCRTSEGIPRSVVFQDA